MDDYNYKYKMDNALIIFSRLPIGRETKTRLAGLLSEAERERLHIAMWQDVFKAVSGLREMINLDVYLYWTGSGSIGDYAEFIPDFFTTREQCSGSLGIRMCQAIHEIFNDKYKRVCLIGSDIPSVSPDNLNNAFKILESNDAVIGAALDGGYWLIGMRRFIPEAFNLSPRSWGKGSVFQATLEHMASQGVSCGLCDTLPDIDTPEDIAAFLNLNQPGTHTINMLNSLEI